MGYSQQYVAGQAMIVDVVFSMLLCYYLVSSFFVSSFHVVLLCRLQANIGALVPFFLLALLVLVFVLDV